MRKQILLISPIPVNYKLESGISIRVNEVSNWFKNKGIVSIQTDQLDESLINKAQFIYAFVSTKTESIIYQLKKTKYDNLIIDLYTPLLLEKKITLSKWNPVDWFKGNKNQSIVKKILRMGSHFTVANFRQKKYWLEQSKYLGLNIKSRDISVLPTGSSKLSAIKAQKRNVILWFGGIYPWMDPLPAIKALSKIAKKNSNLKFRLLGGFYPKTGYYSLFNNVIRQTKKLINNSQLEVMPWQETKNLPRLFSDVLFAIHLPKQTREDYYAHRVRLLTLTNFGIPILTSGNDVISQIILRSFSGLKIKADVSGILKVMENTIKSGNLINKMSKNALNVQSIYMKKESNFSNLEKFFNG